MDKKDTLKALVKKSGTLQGDGIIIAPRQKPTFSNVLKRSWEGLKNVADEVAPFHVETQTDKALKRDMDKANPYLTKGFKDYIKKTPMDSRIVSVRRFNKNPLQDLSYKNNIIVGKDQDGKPLKVGAYFERTGPKETGRIVTGNDDPDIVLHEASHAYDDKKRDILDKSLLSYINKNKNRTPSNWADRAVMKRMNQIKSKALSGSVYSGNRSTPYGLEDGTELRAYNLSDLDKEYFTEGIYPRSKEMQKQYSGVIDKDRIEKDIEKNRKEEERLFLKVQETKKKLKILRFPRK